MSESYNQKVKDIMFLVRGAGDHINEQTVDLILRFNAMLDVDILPSLKARGFP